MFYLGKEIILDTASIDIAVFIFSLISLICSIFIILIYLNVKSLRTVIYRVFFHIAINEAISRFAHFLHFINLSFNNQILFDIYVILIYLTDTNILLFITFSCYTMYEIILNQNKKINNQLNIILTILYCASFIITITFFIISVKTVNGRHIELYRNVIALNFIKDFDMEGNLLAPLLLTSIIYILLVIYALYKTFLIHLFIRKKGNSNEIEEDENSNNRKREKSLKLTSFSNKMMQYPLLIISFVLPIMIYSWLEYYKDKDNLGFLRTRFVFYNINCFLNSIRGYMIFKVFMSNEKIKIYLFTNYLKSSIFYSIEKIIDINELITKNKQIDPIKGIEGIVPLVGCNEKINEDNDNIEILNNINDKEKTFLNYNVDYLEVDKEYNDIIINNPDYKTVKIRRKTRKKTN
jgi:hypothetical protein